MKPKQFFEILFLTAIMFTFYSCSKEVVEKQNELLEFSNLTYFDGICSTDCFTPNGYVKKIGEKTVNAGINTKEVSYTAYNTETDFILETTYHVTEGNSKAEATIILNINGIERKFEGVQSGTTVTHTIPLSNNWSKCDIITYGLRQVALGSPVEMDGTYGLVDICPSGNIYQIGDEAKGGIIGYILQPNDPGYDPNYQHGLVVSPTDLGSNINWDTDANFDLTNANSLVYGSGFNNTQLIVETLGNDQADYAAKYCDDLNIGGYSDWFLPSKNELEKILINANSIGNIYIAFSQPTYDSQYLNNAYWTSSEYDKFNAIVLGIDRSNSLFSATLQKNYNMLVRAVRYF